MRGSGKLCGNGTAQKKKFQVEFLHERVVEVSDDQSLLEASLIAGTPHYHVCGGHARCSTCRVLVVEGGEYLTQPNEREEALKAKMQFPPNVRLACQTHVTGGPVRVQRIIRDKTDIDLYVNRSVGVTTQQIGDERELALFFLDIRNFTSFIESHLPFDVIHIVRRLFGLFRDAIETDHGKVIETAGDGLYAVFGLDKSLSEAAQLAVHAGRTILDSLATFNETYVQPFFNYQVEVGIGLHVGKVISGNIGLAGNNNQTVMGLPVNVAARLQSATKQLNNNFVVSGDVFRLLTDQPLDVSQTTVHLRGMRGKLQVYLMGKSYESQLPITTAQGLISQRVTRPLTT